MDQNNKIYNVIIDPAANDRMAEHLEFLARVSESAANKLLIEFLKDIDSLKYFPYRNPIYFRNYLPLDKYRYMLSGKRYRIVYQIEGEIDFIDDIQDCRQDDDKNII